ATAPDAAPSAVGLPRWMFSTSIQLSAAAAAAALVTTKAFAASPSAAKALPALNPNHPNHSRAVPSRVIVRLCGAISSLPRLLRGPSIKAHTSAAIPDDICTTVPPAKSRAPNPPSQPPDPHTQWQIGVYTSVVHSS